MTSAFKNTTINDTGQLTLPTGTTAQRPNFKIETFTSNTTWTCPTDVTEIEVLVVAGGGGGGGVKETPGGAGGGAGGLVYRSAFSVTPASTYTVTIGSGGAGGSGLARGANGQNSVFGSLTATGGGGGGTYTARSGFTGGSGGGSAWGGGVSTAGALGTTNQGFDGGTHFDTAGSSDNQSGAGGGGAGGQGGNILATTDRNGGSGGSGLLFNISGTPTWYAGGGGGGGGYGDATAGASGSGGQGGGGAGGAATSTGSDGSNGGTNTGGGGGGAGGDNAPSPYTTRVGGTGGSGVVIIRYIAKKEFTANTSWTVPTGVNEVEVLVVAGGGGGGGTATGGQTPSGGGGGGGVLYRPNFAVTPGASIAVTVGSGGAGAAATNGASGTKGGNSAFGTLEAEGGGAGAGNSAGGNGGSGGGGRNGSGGISTTGQGFDGAASAGGTNPAGGGGGAGGVGQRGDTQGSAVLGTIGGHGGPGLPSTITGTLKYYGGGGGGGGYGTIGGNGGIGGGGRGNPSASGTTNGQNANTNTGGGGGGAGSSNGGTGGNGGSGIVVIRYNPDTTAGVFDNTFSTNKIRFNTTSNKFEAPKIISSPTSRIEYPITDGLALLLDAGAEKSYPKLNIIQVKCWTVTTAVRAANYTVQYSDDGTTWTTAFGGVMDATGTAGMITGTVTSGGSGTTGTGAWGRRRHWRYVEGSTVTGHHPRVSRIMLIDNEGTEHELAHFCQDNVSDSGNYIVGTVSTSVLGKTWYDLSGNNRHFHLNRMVSTDPSSNTTSPGQFFVEAGPLSYFGINSNPIISHAITTQRQIPFLGPPSDQMGLTQEHTIISIIRAPGATINFNFHFALSPRDINPELPAWGQNGDGSIRFSSHILYGGDTFYYDFPGCCDSQNRVDWANGAGSTKTGGNITGGVNMNASWTNAVKMATWRCRRTDFPRKQFYREQTVEYSSQQREVGYAIYNRSDPGHLCTGFTGGRQYYFAMYDRALTDAELSTQWTYLQNRFRIS